MATASGAGNSKFLGAHAQLSERVRSYLRDMIVSGRVASGEYLRLDPLAAELGISTTPVREALLGLASEGFVALRPRLGFQVLPITPDDIRDIFLVQAFLAGELAARAAQKITDEAIAELTNIQTMWEAAAAAGDIERVEQFNYEFHRLINVTGDAPKLALFLRSATRYAPRVFYSDIHGWNEVTPESHRKIMDALQARDPDATRQAMEEHIHRAGQQLGDHLRNVEPESGGLSVAADA